ncbi:MAG TPA: pyridoxamine 5'-phosphate oxidase family protein [Solirubrobacteraceae bacterium]|nr:pyridoxamine 5'-phosphate oxidase family protein [Solirubrobacteraceae bacterium]
MLPDWPPGTVVILATEDGAPHAIPVSAAIRAADDRILLALAVRRGSLARLRVRPRVAVALLAPGIAITAEGDARVVAEPLTDGTVGVEVTVEVVRDHDRPTFAIQSGVGWRWTDEQAARRDTETREALRRLAG